MLKQVIAVCFMILISIVHTVQVEGNEVLNIYYISSDNQGDYDLAEEGYEFYGAFEVEEKAYILFYNLFYSGKYLFVPTNTKIIDLYVEDGQLTLNVSNDILSYGGGSSYENCMTLQIIKTALSIERIKSITLLIDGMPAQLIEGSVIYVEENIPIGIA